MLTRVFGAQNIDETFSKIHNVLSNRILPAVKRYAVGTEPVREAAKVSPTCSLRELVFFLSDQFWTSFYEQAAQIRIPTYDDFSSTNDQQSSSAPGGTETESKTTSADTTDSQTTVTSVEGSFLPGQAAFSSTPATSSRQPDQTPSEPDTTAQSWTASSYTTASSERSRLRKDKQPESLFRQALHSASSKPQSQIGYVSPLKFRKPKTPVPKKLNPYLPPDTQPSEWSGIVDLAQSPLATPRTAKRVGQSPRRHAHFRPLIPMQPQDDTVDESFDGLPPGMSPPKLMSPARPPRSSAELILGKTPIREAAGRITRDLLSDVQRKTQAMPLRRNLQYSGIDSSMSTLPTPPSLTRYQYGTDTSGSLAFDSSLEQMMERVGLREPRPASSAAAVDPYSSTGMTTIATPAGDAVTPTDQAHQDSYDDGDFNSDDSLEDVNDTAHPSAAFLMASQRPAGRDDSFDSNDSDDDDEDMVDEGLAPVHPFAQGSAVYDEDGFDDSFDDGAFGGGGSQETDTLFGVHPGRVMEQRRPDRRLVMLGQRRLPQDETDDSTQIARMASERVPDTPTPAVALYDQSSLH